MPKKTLRSQLLAQRSGMDCAAWRSSSLTAQQRLIELEPFQQAGCIALYAPIRHEVDTVLLFQAARAAGKKVLYPQVCGDDLLFRSVSNFEQLTNGAFGIQEPCLTAPVAELVQADLVVVPGVAFDLDGHRLGFGKGYYDRALAGLSRHVVLIGLCHDFQMVERIPAEAHDIRMQYIVTDRRTIKAGTGGMPD